MVNNKTKKYRLTHTRNKLKRIRGGYKKRKKQSKKKQSKKKQSKKKQSKKKLLEKCKTEQTIIKKNKSKKKKKNKYIIGIVTVPLTPTKKFYKVCGDSYISSRHITWLKENGFETLYIPYDTKNLEEYLDKVHGVYLPSGGAFSGTQMTYYRCCKNIINYSIKTNDRGVYFPLWGCCMGFQQMLIVADGNDNVKDFLQNFDSFKNLMCKIKITKEGKLSKIVKGIDKSILKRIQKEKCTLNNHFMGISPSKFKRIKLINDFYKIVGTSKDRKGKEFIAILEARNYPFFAVQWHPERSQEMNTFIKFFAKEVKKSKRKRHTLLQYKKHNNMFTKKINCYNYSEGLYKKCNFFWHKRTSAHNRNLCNAAQLKSNKPEIGA